MKTYSGQSGYVYQYYYEGQRTARDATEFVFNVSGDRKTWFPVSVFVRDRALAAWQQRHERDLHPTERYAISKMALFAAFDARPSPESMRDPVEVAESQVDEILSTLNID